MVWPCAHRPKKTIRFLREKIAEAQLREDRFAESNYQKRLDAILRGEKPD